jgi:Fur family ferric uptake transcriptional regulator
MKKHVAIETAGLDDALHRNGLRITPARRAIFSALVKSGGHVTADDLVDIVRERAGPIGRMTVYRTLDLLNGLGLIRAVYQGTGAAHYVLMNDGHHHHLTCTGCGTVIELQECQLESVEQQVGERFNFRVTGHLVEIYGKCESCQG